ncbi:MAG: branched-chain amino acid ABC transporter permease [Firmicutes bacterium]|jgi:branched-chain amino acid transport system permease protein|nr:branched-chain amino acid ABC transporter permease [Bacillota bacterium]
MFFLQQLVNGLTQGFIYSLMAIGLAMIIGIVGLVSFVNGEVIMIGAFAAFFAVTYFHANAVLALLVGFAASAILGVMLEHVCYRPFRRSSRYMALICTIGMSIFLKSLGQVVFGIEPRFVPDLLGTGFISLGDIRIAHVQIVVVAIVAGLILTLQVLLYRTRTGISLRAVAMDKDAAALVGVNVNHTVMLGNCIGCALGGVSGALIGIYYNSVHALMGASVAMKAFAAVVFGGLTSIPGAAVGGLVLGVVENLAVSFLSSGYKDIVAFLILISILLVKPSGIMGRKGLGV